MPGRFEREIFSSTGGPFYFLYFGLEMTKIAKRIYFSGRVQGVGFRFTAHRIALRYELTGFVRNTSDRKVEMLAQGHPDDIADCIRDLGESFRITDTKITEVAVDSQYIDFQIKF